MGQRMKDVPIIYGANCLLGWDPDKTPKYVYARFSEMVKCPDVPPTFYSTPPNGRVFKLTQDPGIPCRWAVNSGPWEVVFQIISAPTFTVLTITNTDDLGDYFASQVGDFQDEGVVLHNEIVVCQVWNGAHLGIGVVTWTPQATDILKAINLKKGDDLFMEVFPLDDGKLVYKFCRLKDATNIKILFQP